MHSLSHAHTDKCTLILTRTPTQARWFYIINKKPVHLSTGAPTAGLARILETYERPFVRIFPNPKRTRNFRRRRYCADTISLAEAFSLHVSPSNSLSHAHSHTRTPTLTLHRLGVDLNTKIRTRSNVTPRISVDILVTYVFGGKALKARFTKLARTLLNLATLPMTTHTIAESESISDQWSCSISKTNSYTPCVCVNVHLCLQVCGCTHVRACVLGARVRVCVFIRVCENVCERACVYVNERECTLTHMRVCIEQLTPGSKNA